MAILLTGDKMGRITDALSILTTNVKLRNSRGRTDINAEAEDFYCGLLNILLGTELENLNALQMDFPAIDLADREARLCVQVTSTEGRGKVNHTLEKFYERDMEGDFDRLLILVIGEKDRFKKVFPGKGTFVFDPQEDIWDTVKLLAEIERLPEPKRDEVDAYLGKHLNISRHEDQPLLDLPLRTAMAEGSFMGRAEELAEIGKRFETERIVVLSGLGGMGKTELAVRYGRSYAGSGAGRAYLAGFRGDFYRTVVESIALGVEGLAERKLDENDKYRETMKALNRCGREDLLIIDNADTEEGSFEQLRADLSALPMRVLITTRCDPVGAIDVGALHREELHRIFRLYNGSITEGDMDALIHAVDGHTLTVDLMARLLRPGRRAATADKLLTALNKRDLNSPSFIQIATNYPGGLSQARINEHLRTVFRVAELSQNEKTLLRCATLLPTGGMSDELFMIPFEEKMQVVLDDLIQKGWLLWENDLLKIHPVICIVCREELEPKEENCGDFVKGICGWYDERKYDKDRFYQLAELLTNTSKMLSDPEGWYILRAGFFWNQLAELRKALECNLRAAKLLEMSRPESNELTSAYNNVGSAYGAQGNHAKALEYLLKSLAIREKLLSPEHPDLAISYNNVGSTYGALGNQIKALEYKLKALAIYEKVLPRLHPDLAVAYNNVGLSYGALGNYAKSLVYLLSALAIWEKILPPEHPNLAVAYNNLGGTYGNLGDYTQALEYLLKALVIQEKKLPQNHPYNARCCSNISVIYGELGEYEAALGYMRRAADIAEKVFPEGHSSRVCYRKWAEEIEEEIRQRKDE